MDNVRSSKVDFLKAQLEVANSQNIRLNEQNVLLRQKIQEISNQEHSSSTIHVEAKLKAFKLEEERDRIFEKMEKLKRKYNQLYEVFLIKVKRCKAYEEVFNRQKTLNGLVMKSSIDQKQKEQDVAQEKRRSKHIEKNTMETLEVQIIKLQTALDEAYDIIDELEFELESVDFLEIENQRLRNELELHKKENVQLKKAINRINPVEYVQNKESEDNEVFSEDMAYKESLRSICQTDSNASSLADSIVGDIDPETMERAALTESIIKTAESESNCLRRELLRSRLQNVIRRSLRPTSSDA